MSLITSINRIRQKKYTKTIQNEHSSTRLCVRDGEVENVWVENTVIRMTVPIAVKSNVPEAQKDE